MKNQFVNLKYSILVGVSVMAFLMGTIVYPTVNEVTFDDDFSHSIPFALADTPPIHPDDLKKCFTGENSIYDWCSNYMKSYTCNNLQHVLVVREWPQYACVMPLTALTLAWQPSQHIEYMTYSTGFISDVPATTLVHSTNNAKITGIKYDNVNYSIKFNVSTTQVGTIYLNIEREMLDAKIGKCSEDNYYNDDAPYTAIVNGESVHVQNIRAHERTRTISITTMEDQNEIEIFGVCEDYVPRKAIQV